MILFDKRECFKHGLCIPGGRIITVDENRKNGVGNNGGRISLIQLQQKEVKIERFFFLSVEVGGAILSLD